LLFFILKEVNTNKKQGSHKEQKNEAPNTCRDGRNNRYAADVVNVPQTCLCLRKIAENNASK
jgi:hypothetical protein